VPRREHDRAGACPKVLVTDPKHVLSLDDVEELVLVRVHM